MYIIMNKIFINHNNIIDKTPNEMNKTKKDIVYILFVYLYNFSFFIGHYILGLPKK